MESVHILTFDLPEDEEYTREDFRRDLGENVTFSETGLTTTCLLMLDPTIVEEIYKDFLSNTDFGSLLILPVLANRTRGVFPRFIFDGSWVDIEDEFSGFFEPAE